VQPRHSQQWLARLLRIDLPTLQAIAADPQPHYHCFNHKAENGKVRRISKPLGIMMKAQKGILNEILRSAPMPPCVQGSIKGYSPATNARAHQGQRVIVRVDIQNFFPNVTNEKVYEIWFQVFPFGKALARLLTKLTTLEAQLPQGTPTSSYLANFALRRADVAILAIADTHGLRYTRFVDDIVLSGDRARDVIALVIREISREGFTCKRKKTLVAGPRQARTIRGQIAYVKPTNPGHAAKLQQLIDHVTQSDRA
jgi:RNA-directed DNA polymerase